MVLVDSTPSREKNGNTEEEGTCTHQHLLSRFKDAKRTTVRSARADMKRRRQKQKGQRVFQPRHGFMQYNYYGKRPEKEATHADGTHCFGDISGAMYSPTISAKKAGNKAVAKQGIQAVRPIREHQHRTAHHAPSTRLHSYTKQARTARIAYRVQRERERHLAALK